MQAPSHVPCPICSSRVPKAFLNSHVETCLARKQTQQQAALPAVPSHQPPNGTSAAEAVQVAGSDRDPNSASARIEKPMAGVPSPRPSPLPPTPAMGAADAESQAPAGPSISPLAAGAAATPAPCTPASVPQSSQRLPDTASPAPQQRSATANSAFAVLLKSQKDQNPAYQFFLERTDSGRWRWHFWTKGMRIMRYWHALSLLRQYLASTSHAK